MPASPRADWNGVLPLLTPLLSAEAMRWADAYTSETFGLGAALLMESAGRAVAARITEAFGPVAGRRIVVCCGKGNNGGDGYVIARALHAHGADVRALGLGEDAALSEGARRNRRLLEAVLREAGASERLVRYADGMDLAPLEAADLYVDALLGTGVRAPLEGPAARLVGWLSARAAPVVAVDMPSGLHSDTGAACGVAVRAALTVTLAAPKPGLYLSDGPEAAGRLALADIGIPRFILERAAAAHPEGCAWLPTPEAIGRLLPRRGAHAHKYSVGMALVAAGAPGLTGAPVMASEAAARIGAGAVVCACQERVQPVLAHKFTEVMTLGLPEAPDGGIEAEGALKALGSRLEQARALLVGCGIGRAASTHDFVRRLLGAAGERPVVVDADGLGALAGHTDGLARAAGGRWVLTPHAGEFSRLAGEEVDLTHRLGVARRYAHAWNCVLVLKGLPSLVAAPDGRVALNPTGGPALATAGTGDILAGMCAGLLAQGLAPFEAAVCALYVGGAAADRFVAEHGAPAMLATDLLGRTPGVLGSLLA